MSETREYTEEQMRTWYAMTRQYVANKNWKPQAAAARFRERFGDFPPREWDSDPGKEPSEALVRWHEAKTKEAPKRDRGAPGQAGTADLANGVQRIAGALERIATALEQSCGVEP